MLYPIELRAPAALPDEPADVGPRHGSRLGGGVWRARASRWAGGRGRSTGHGRATPAYGAERGGFEPPDPASRVNSLAVSPIRPLSHLSLAPPPARLPLRSEPAGLGWTALGPRAPRAAGQLEGPGVVDGGSRNHHGAYPRHPEAAPLRRRRRLRSADPGPGAPDLTRRPAPGGGRARPARRRGCRTGRAAGGQVTPAQRPVCLVDHLTPRRRPSRCTGDRRGCCCRDPSGGSRPWRTWCGVVGTRVGTGWAR